MQKLVLNRYSVFLPGKCRSKAITPVFCILLLSFTTCTEDPEIMPKLITLEAASADITGTTAILKGEIKTLGNMNIIEYGIEISNNMLFSPSVIKGYSTPAVAGIFQIEFSDIDPNTIYYYRAYATINTAQVYSDNRPQFTTKPARK